MPEDEDVKDIVIRALALGKGHAIRSNASIILSGLKGDYESLRSSLTIQQRNEAKLVMKKMDKLLSMFQQAYMEMQEQDRKNKIYFLGSTVLAVAGIVIGIILALVL